MELQIQKGGRIDRDKHRPVALAADEAVWVAGGDDAATAAEAGARPDPGRSFR